MTTKNEKTVVNEVNEVFDFNSILKSLDSSLFVSNSGMRKENIYKKDVFASCITDRDKKTLRRKIRNIVENFMKSILLQKDAKKLTSLVLQFDKFYKATYSNNDYSLESLSSANTDFTKKENLLQMLSICKKELKIS